MQLNKSSKKTAKNAEKPVVAAPETGAAAEVKAKPRASRSSKTKKSEGPQEMTSGKNLHKSASPVLAEPVVSEEPGFAAHVETVTSSPVAIDRDKVAELAYFYWVERNHAHGFAEHDWLRAEKTLSASAG